MKSPRSFFIAGRVALAAILSFPCLLRAQSAAETLQQRATVREIAAPPATSVSTDQDLGDIDVVQRYPKPETLTFSTTQQYFYTDNVFYTDAHPAGSSAYLGSYTASYVPYSLRDWTPRITLQYNMVRYDRVAEGDFDNENAAFSSQYNFGSDRSWSWTPFVNLSRFTASHDNDHEFYKEVFYDNQVAHVMPLAQNVPLYFIAAYDLAYHQASPAQFDRLDNILSFSFLYNPFASLSIGPYVRTAARTYTTNAPAQNNRDDFNLSEGIDVTWSPCKYFSLSGDFTRSDNWSNNTPFTYENMSPGVSVTGVVKF